MESKKMATHTLVSVLEKISEGHLECCICQERYKEPKILDCLHSFCEQCLEKYYSSRYRDTPTIPCPVCEKKTILPETKIQGLKTNFHLSGMVEEFALQEKVASSGDTKVLCETCDEGEEATHRCLDCAQNICSKCQKIHTRIAASSGHTVATFEDIRQSKVKPKRSPDKDVSKCHKHKGEVKRFFCVTCKELICRDCTVVDHCKPQHHYVDSGEASLKRKQSLREIFPAFSQDINELKQSLAATSQAKEELTMKITKTMKEVQDRAAKMREDVTTQEKKILDEVRQLRKDRHIAFDEHEKTVSVMLQAKQHALEMAEEVTKMASDSDFLVLYPTISKEVKLLRSQVPPKIDRNLLYLDFNLSQGTGDINLGKLKAECKWELCREFGRKGRGPGEFSLARGITASQSDEVAVADSTNRQVVICSIEGQPKHIILMQQADLGGIAAMYDQLVVVDMSKYVKVINKAGKLAFQFPTVPPSQIDQTAVELWSVAVKDDGTIIIGDIKRKVLTEHRPEDGSLIRTIPVSTPPYFLAVGCRADQVVVSGFQQEVAQVDSNGATLFTIKPTIDGQPVKGCRGVCCDNSGIYVAMHNGEDTGHIHHYDEYGTFIRCAVKGLHYPQGITITADGQLAVADFYSVKIYRD